MSSSHLFWECLHLQEQWENSPLHSSPSPFSHLSLSLAFMSWISLRSTCSFSTGLVVKVTVSSPLPEGPSHYLDSTLFFLLTVSDKSQKFCILVKAKRNGKHIQKKSLNQNQIFTGFQTSVDSTRYNVTAIHIRSIIWIQSDPRYLHTMIACSLVLLGWASHKI